MTLLLTTESCDLRIEYRNIQKTNKVSKLIHSLQSANIAILSKKIKFLFVL